jgi:hypothetical protein
MAAMIVRAVLWLVVLWAISEVVRAWLKLTDEIGRP